jgi:predicted Fe-Mo cluster-binding NifX family protein
MRIAIPLFGDQVAPRFCAADEVLLVDVDGGEETTRRTLDLGGRSLARRLDLLHELGVQQLLCGGFNRSFLPQAERLAIQVFWGLCGPVDAVLAASVAGELPPADPDARPMGGRPGLGQGGRRGRGGPPR